MTRTHPTARASRTGSDADLLQDVLSPDIPLHHQIYLQMRAEILDGLWVRRTDFPGVDELADSFGVSVVTAAKALERLTQEGWLRRSRGRRPRVIHAPFSARVDSAPEVFHHVGRPQAARYRDAFTYRVLQRSVTVAPAQACRAFRLAPGSNLWMCTRLRVFKHRPHSVAYSFQLPENGACYTLAKLRTTAMHRLLTEACLDVESLSRTIGVSLATPLIARHLHLRINDPTLVYTFAYADSRKRVIDWTRVYVNPVEPSPIEVFNFKSGEWSLGTEWNEAPKDERRRRK